jgi:hypothetical protein
MLARTQWKTEIEAVPLPPMGYYFRSRYTGIDYNAVINIARALGIPLDHIFLSKLNLFEHQVLKILYGTDKDTCNEQQKEKCRFEFGEFFEWACKTCKEGEGMNDA